jgi:hypothetical protein
VSKFHELGVAAAAQYAMLSGVQVCKQCSKCVYFQLGAFWAGHTHLGLTGHSHVP